MTLTLTDELEQVVIQTAERLGISRDEFVRRAVTWFLRAEPDIQAEFEDWQQMTWKAWDMVEQCLP